MGTSTSFTGSDFHNPEPVWEDKCWGRVWHRFYDRHCGESLLDVNAGWRCSMHWHESRHNTFVVVSGKIAIDIHGFADQTEFVEPGARWAEHILAAGDAMTVKPNVWHQFRVLESGRVIEVYYTTDGTPVIVDDIVRFDTGGKIAA